VSERCADIPLARRALRGAGGSLRNVIWIFSVLSLLTTFVIAAVSIGAVTAGLATRARRSVYDLDEAVEWVGDALDDDVTAVVTFDDVRAVLGWNLDFLQSKGIASLRTADDPGSGLIVVGDAEPLAYILGKIDEAEADSPGAQLTDEQVEAVLAANRSYEQSIGAIGDEVAPPTLD